MTRLAGGLLALSALVMMGCHVSVSRGGGDFEVLQPYGKPKNPFSPAVRVGKLIYLSGEVGTDSTDTLVPGGIEAETRQTMENIKRTLGTLGLGMDRLVKCTVFVADIAEWPRMNVVYRSYFPDGKYPARAAFQAAKLVLNARVELDCVAAAK